jgi:acetylornithine deacetylase/succinyl-diaminopimelate desuccinylase-like protein
LWDIGQGANEDGSGIMATFQAVALIKKLGLKPRRTIRVCFWVNEENGGAGGRAYRAMIGDAIAIHIAAIEMDGGAEKPIGFGFGGGGPEGRETQGRTGAASSFAGGIPASGGDRQTVPLRTSERSEVVP